MLDFYLDETHLRINARPVLLYGIVIPINLERVIQNLLDLKRRHGLEDSLEIKWALQHSDPRIKAQVKEEVIELLAREFRCMVSISEGTDKHIAFVNALRQIHGYATREGNRCVNIFYDQGAFTKPSRIYAELDSWTDIRCTTFGCLDSEYSVPIQFADMLAGTFRYMLQASLGRPSVTVTVHDEGLTDIEMPLNQFFQVILRYSMIGEHPNIDPNANDFDPADIVMECLGTGIVLNGSFSEDEIEAVKQISSFYLGCMH